MPNRVDWHKQMMGDLLEVVNLNRENPSRYTSEGHLKPLCAPDEHRPFRNSTRCEVCGLVVRGSGASMPMAPGQH